MAGQISTTKICCVALFKKTSYNFAFQASILNQRGPNWNVLRLIQWQNLKHKIVAVFFLNNSNFANIAKISDSVDFEQP